VLWRWLEIGHHYSVTFIRNVTDVEDKILAKSAEAGSPWWAWALRFEREFAAAYDALGLRRPSYEPRATGHVPEMITLIERLIARGHAYRAEDGSADVYFDVRSWPEYGSLTRQRVDDMAPAQDADPRGKRDPRDFALWKGAAPDSPAVWPTPFGAGRPGWHLECSAMAHKYLGSTFDIHGGGIDLRFPHHENEQAQSRAAGDGFARYWVHNGWVTTSGEKMSKSLGNSLLVSSVLRKVRPLVLRYWLGSAQYRSNLEYHPGSLAEAATATERLEGFVKRAMQVCGAPGDAETVTMPPEFIAAMDDDLNVSAALAALHETLRKGNTALDSGDQAQAGAALSQVLAMADVLGINPLDPVWQSTTADPAAARALDVLVTAELARRSEARAAKDWSAADAVRNRLRDAGIQVIDGKNGPSWQLTGRH
jgi:cysteinyl-tRNA synthetase